MLKQSIRSLYPTRTIMSASLNVSTLSQWDAKNKTDPVHNFASTVLKNYNADDLLLNKTRLQQQDKRIFNKRISVDPSPVTNQRASGRCWLFAGTNELRCSVIKELNLKEFELSQAYLFFYDKLEKANYFLDQIIQTKNEPVESRLVQYLLTAPTQDGGQYSMFWNIVKKYGIIPKDLYNDMPFSTTASRKWNALLTTKLREMAQQLRDAEESELETLRSNMQQEIFRMMSLFMDYPPVSPNEKFHWEYQDKDKNIKSLDITPLEFASKYCKLNWEQPPVSLINDPRHEYGKLIKIDRLGNVIGGDDVLYLNVNNETLSKLVVKRLEQDKPVFFGSHTPKYMDKKNGIMDVQLWNYEAIGYKLTQDKANRIKYNESLMTHAMLITGAHVEEGKEIPTRYCVENSWGKDSGKDGLYVMTQEYFEEYCYQIVVDLEDLPTELAQKFSSKKEEPIVLPIWDPMGALA
ncbi:cysteine proteinase 1, mitochondrial [Monosporozyma servazzii]